MYRRCASLYCTDKLAVLHQKNLPLNVKSATTVYVVGAGIVTGGIIRLAFVAHICGASTVMYFITVVYVASSVAPLK